MPSEGARPSRGPRPWLVRGAVVLVVLLGAVRGRAGADPVAAEPADLLRARGVERYLASDWAGAAELLGRAEARGEGTPSGKHYLGLALIRLGRRAEGRRALAAAAAQDPGDAELLLDLGLAYLAEGNPAWAVRALDRAKELSPEAGPIRYRLGLALLGMGEAGAAADELARAIRLGGIDARDAKLELGLALVRARRYEESRAVLDALLGWDALVLVPRSSPSTMGGMARGLLRAALEAEGVQSSFLSAEVTVGFVLDTNPLYEHETRSPAGVGPSVAASLTLRPWVDSRNSLAVQISGARSTYFATGSEPATGGETPVGDASVSTIRAGAVYSRRARARGRKVELSLGYEFGLTFLDGGEPLADSNHIFLEEHGGLFQLRIPWRDSQASTLIRYTLAREDFAALARNNLGNGLTVEQSLLLLGERLRLLGWIGLRHQDAEAAYYHAVIPGVGLGASWLAPLDIVLGARVEYELRDYYDSESGPWGKQRVDHNVVLTAEASRALPLGLRLRAIYQRYQNPSTVETFDHHRDLLQVAVSWSTP
jgi:tetratricopeptide (TPR) repeat protein